MTEDDAIIVRMKQRIAHPGRLLKRELAAQPVG
jgi:hypothetical protein